MHIYVLCMYTSFIKKICIKAFKKSSYMNWRRMLKNYSNLAKYFPIFKGLIKGIDHTNLADSMTPTGSVILERCCRSSMSHSRFDQLQALIKAFYLDFFDVFDNDFAEFVF